MHILDNYIDGAWRTSRATDFLAIRNPATTEILGQVPLAIASDVAQAAQGAAAAFLTWRRTPATERVQYLFKLKGLLEAHYDDLATTITLECSKTTSDCQ